MIAVWSDIHINTLCGQNAAFPSVKPNGPHLQNTDLFLKQRLTVNAAAVPVRTVTMLAGMSVGSGRASHVWCVVVTEAMHWREQIKQCLYWLLIQQHVSTGTQIRSHVWRPCPSICSVRTTLWACPSLIVTNPVANRGTPYTWWYIAASLSSCHWYLRTINAMGSRWHFKLNTLNFLQALLIKQEVWPEVFTVSALSQLYVTFTGQLGPFCALKVVLFSNVVENEVVFFILVTPEPGGSAVWGGSLLGLRVQFPPAWVFQVEVYVTGRSLVQRIPTSECVCHSVWSGATITLCTYSE